MTLINDPVLLVSLAQLGELSAHFRTQVKKGLTKSHVNKKTPATVTTNFESLFIETSNFDDPVPVKGNAAPRVQGSINNHPCELILDGGCTPCIISFFREEVGLRKSNKSYPKSIVIGRWGYSHGLRHY